MNDDKGSSQKLEEELNRIESIAKNEGANTQTKSTEVPPVSPVAPPADPNTLESNSAEVADPNPAPEQAIPNSVPDPNQNPISEQANPVKPDFTQELQPEEKMPLASQPLTNNKKSSKVIMIIVVVLFILSLAGLTFYFIGSRESEVKETPAPVVTFAPTPTATTDPTAGWKTYTNSKYGFSLLFPNAWDSCMTQGTGSFLVAPGKCNPPYAEYYLSISVLVNEKEVPDYMGPGDPNAYTSTGKQTITIGIQQFIKQKFTQINPITLNGKEYPAGPTVIFYDLVDNTHNQVIEFYKSPTSNLDETTIDQVLSTLKFIESTATPSASPATSPTASASATPTATP